jgi:hypothetical protein
MLDESKSDFDYDLRQITLMEEQLSQFESGRITLSHLITGLNALQNCLRTVSRDWKKVFTGEWWTLEQVHAVSLNRKETMMSSEDLALVKGAVDNLRKLIIQAKEKLESEST